MQIAFVLFDGFTALDVTGPYDVLNALPHSEPVLVAEQRGPVANESRTLSLVADRSLAEVSSPEILVVPGGLGTRVLLEHEPLLSWLREVHENTTWTTSVCTGSLLLAAAGILDGARATTHWLAREQLAALGVEVVPERVVEDGKIVSGAGVSAGIDMALALVQRMYGKEAAEAIQLGIEYDPHPPVDSGSPDCARPEIVATVTAAFRAAESRFLGAAGSSDSGS